MPDRIHEQTCRDAFDLWLRARYPKAKIVWENGDDPPDFVLLFDGRRFAVEVTRIVDEQTGDRASLWSIVDQIESDLRRTGVLRGTYAVTFAGTPETETSWRRLSQALRQFITDYVERTDGIGADDAGERRKLGQQVQCRIRKLSGYEQIIGPVGPHDGGGWEPDIRAEVTSLLNRVLKKKGMRADAKVADVLVLHDAYALASPRLFKECLRTIPEAAKFHTIYVVQGRDQGYLGHGGDFSSSGLP